MTPLRIDNFIKSKLREAHSDGFYGLKSSAEAARSHGFTACANSRYVDFLEDMSAARDQVTYYAEKYPACFFLPWTALNATLKALNLWCDLPKHYTGAIPPGQLPYLDIFSLDPSDAAPPAQMLELLGDEIRRVVWEELIFQAVFSEHEEFKRFSLGAPLLNSLGSQKAATLRTVRTACEEFTSSWFVIAPPAAFNVAEDWRSRTRKLLAQAADKKEPPPDDPLVVRFVRDGCLVVAAWGEEAAELNAAVNSINI